MVSAVITCAGNHTRFGRDKLFLLIDGEPVFVRTVRQFLKASEVNEVVLVTRKTSESKIRRGLAKYGLNGVVLVDGGEERCVSAYNGVLKSRGEWVLIHDGARPLVSVDLINRVSESVKDHNAVMTAVEATTCVKIVDLGEMEVKECLDRRKSWLGQTPHAFRREIILSAYQKAINGEIFGMDDCELVRKTGVRVKVVPGEWTNKKITLPMDIDIIRKWYGFLKSGREV